MGKFQPWHYYLALSLGFVIFLTFTGIYVFFKERKGKEAIDKEKEKEEPVAVTNLDQSSIKNMGYEDRIEELSYISQSTL